MSFKKHFDKTHHHNISYFVKCFHLKCPLSLKANYLHARILEIDSKFIYFPHDYHLSLNGANFIGRYLIF
jgi:hypothetical protein